MAKHALRYCLMTAAMAGMLTIAQAATPVKVSIVPAAKDATDYSQQTFVDTYTARNVPLGQALQWLHQEAKLEGSDFAALPEGKFDIRIEGPMGRSPATFDALAAEIQKQFGVTVTVAEVDMEGLTLEIPADAKVKKTTYHEALITNNLKGWELKCLTSSQVAVWLGDELRKPVKAKGDTTTRYDFQVETDLSKPDQLPAALAKVGLKTEPAKIKVKVIKTTKK